MPERYREEVYEKLEENPDLLTKTGQKKLYSNINIKLLFSIRTDKLIKLEFFDDKINLTKNIIEIKSITAEQAKTVLLNTSSFEHKYHIDNNFISNPFKISDNLINEILNFLSKGSSQTIETYQLQIIGREIEKISIEKNLEIVDIKDIGNFEDIYKDYYESIVEKIKDSKQQISARKFIEDELIFEYEHRKLTIYEGIANQKYKLSDETIKYLLDNHLIRQLTNNTGDTFYEVSHDALLTPILLAKEKRIQYEIKIEEELSKKQEIEKQAELQKQKAKRNRKFAITFLGLLIISIFLGITAIYQKNKAYKNQIFAQSNLYTSYALQYIDSDPTLSFRLAQKAYETNNNNLSVSSLLKVFYKTNIFYNVLNVIDENFDKIIISHDGNKYALIYNSGKDKYVKINNINGDSLNQINFSKTISSACFSEDDSKILISTRIDGLAYLYNTTGDLISKYNHGNFLLYSSIIKNDIILTCGNDNTAKIWNDTLNPLILNHSTSVEYISASKDNKLFVTVESDNKVIVWNDKGEKISEYEYLNEVEGQITIISGAEFSEDASKILITVNTLSADTYHVKIWDWKENKTLNAITLNSWINKAKYINENTFIAFTKSGKAYILNTETSVLKEILGHSDEIYDIVALDDNILVSASKDKTIRSWKIFNPNINFENFTDKRQVIYSNQGSFIAMLDGKLSIISLTGELVYEKEAFDVQSFNFSTDDKFLLINTDSTSTVVNLATKETNIISPENQICFSKITDDDSKIVLGTKSHIYFYDISGNYITKNKIEEPINKATFLTTDIIAFAEKEVKIIDNKGTIKKRISLSNIKYAKNSSGKKQTILLANDTNIYIFDKLFEQKNEIKTSAEITSIAISKNADYIAYGDIMGNCVIMDINGKEIYNFKQNGRILNIDFSSNEKTILILSERQNMTTKICSYIISPDEIINYIDELKLYGNVQKFTEEELNIVTMQ